jgi:ketosteroid isomerase-like protein
VNFWSCFLHSGQPIAGEVEAGRRSGGEQLKTEFSRNPDDMKVQVYGNTAVVTYGSTDKGTYKGKDLSGKYRWMDVFVKHKGRWQLVAGQGTPFPKQ